MGNSLSCKQRKKKAQEAAENDYETDTNKERPTNEDVLYASIDHNPKPEGHVRALEDNDCDYAVVRIPDKAKHKHSKDCSDDYVLMG